MILRVTNGHNGVMLSWVQGTKFVGNKSRIVKPPSFLRATLTSVSSKQEQQEQRHHRVNEKLNSVKAAGLAALEQTTKLQITKTKNRLLENQDDSGPSVLQIREAHRLHTMVQEAIDLYSQRHTTFTIQCQPIVILEAEVSPDRKQARLYWALPYSTASLPDNVVAKMKEKMDQLLKKHGGKIQTLVHSRLRSYYPPKIRFVPADDELFHQDLMDLSRS